MSIIAMDLRTFVLFHHTIILKMHGSPPGDCMLAMRVDR
jgi:hypothetical protein